MEIETSNFYINHSYNEIFSRDVLKILLKYIGTKTIIFNKLFLICKSWNQVYRELIYKDGEYYFTWNQFINFYKINNILPKTIKIRNVDTKINTTNMYNYPIFFDFSFVNVKKLSFETDTMIFDKFVHFWSYLVNLKKLTLNGSFDSFNHKTIYLPLLTKKINGNLEELTIKSTTDIDDSFILCWTQLKKLKIWVKETSKFRSKLLGCLKQMTNLTYLKYKLRSYSLSNNDIFIGSKLKTLILDVQKYSTYKIYEFENPENVLHLNAGISDQLGLLTNLQSLNLLPINHLNCYEKILSNLKQLTYLKTMEICDWQTISFLKNLMVLDTQIHSIELFYYFKKIDQNLPFLRTLILRLLQVYESSEQEYFIKSLFLLKNITRLILHSNGTIFCLEKFKTPNWMYIEIKSKSFQINFK